MLQLRNLILFFVLIISSCDDHPTSDPAQDTPEALETKESSYLSKRYSGDLVDELFEERVEKSKDLKEMEEMRKAINNDRLDSIERFDKYDQKSIHYYSSATRHVDRIGDSLLKNRILNLITQSKDEYSSAIRAHKNILRNIDSNGKSVNDLHEALQVALTLEDIQLYQKKNLPSTKPLETISARQKELMRRLGTKLKQSGG